MRQPNDGGDTEPGVQFTVITTRNDEVVTPCTSAFLSGANVTNIVVQRRRPRGGSRRTLLGPDPHLVRRVPRSPAQRAF